MSLWAVVAMLVTRNMGCLPSPPATCSQFEISVALYFCIFATVSLCPWNGVPWAGGVVWTWLSNISVSPGAGLVLLQADLIYMMPLM